MPSVAAVRSENDNLTKIIKYIPTEIITLYTAIVAVIPLTSSGEADPTNLWMFKVSISILLILTPVWKYYSVKDNPEPVGGSKTRAARFHTAIASISFLLYVYVSNHPYLSLWFTNPSTKQPTPYLNPIAGTILLLLFSFVIPMLEGFFLKSNSDGNQTPDAALGT